MKLKAVVEILSKLIVSTKFQTNHSKIYGNSAFPQNIHARKLEVKYSGILKIFQKDGKLKENRHHLKKAF